MQLWVALHSLINYRSNYLGKPAAMEEPMEEQEEESDEVRHSSGWWQSKDVSCG